MQKQIIFIVVMVILFGVGFFIFLKPEKLPEEGFFQEEGEENVVLEDVLYRAEDIENISYKIEVMNPIGSFVARFWQKGEKMRMETTPPQGQKIINIVRKDNGDAFIYMPTSNIATKVGVEGSQEVIRESVKEKALSVLNHDPVILGKEDIKEKSCIVIQYSTSVEKVKMWIWEEYGFPIKEEVETESGLTKTEISSVDFSEIPENLFEIPEEVELKEEIPYF